MSEETAFFMLDGERLVPTVLTRGPWSPIHQHGGPPSAVMARAIEQAADEPDSLRMTRFTVDFLRPIPMPPLIVTADLTVSLLRVPDGEWIGLDALTALEPHGIGLTRSGLYDTRGPIGEALQGLVAGQPAAS